MYEGIKGMIYVRDFWWKVKDFCSANLLAYQYANKKSGRRGMNLSASIWNTEIFFVVFKNLNKCNAVSVLLGIDTFKATTVFCWIQLITVIIC